MNTVPAGTASLTRTGSRTVPRRLLTWIVSASAKCSLAASAEWTSTYAPGSRRTSFSHRAVRVSVCQWEYSRPVVRMNGNS